MIGRCSNIMIIWKSIDFICVINRFEAKKSSETSLFHIIRDIYYILCSFKLQTTQQCSIFNWKMVLTGFLLRINSLELKTSKWEPHGCSRNTILWQQWAYQREIWFSGRKLNLLDAFLFFNYSNSVFIQ